MPPKHEGTHAHFFKRKTIQLALCDSAYARWLSGLLRQDGQHRVLLLTSPDLTVDGIVVVDEHRIESLASVFAPKRFVVFARKGTDNLSRLWRLGIRHVVFEGSSAESAHLTILAAELKLLKPPGPGAI